MSQQWEMYTVSGNITTQGTIYSDRISSPATNANLILSASGTGAVDVQSALTTIGQTITGVASITGQLNADNIRIRWQHNFRHHR
jgi:hypothetical protein